MIVASASVPRLVLGLGPRISPRVESPVDLDRELLRQAERLDAPPKPPDRRMVRRVLIERNAAAAPIRQAIATASSAPESKSPRHCYSSTILNIVSGG
jgi:hypothetical protein